MSRGGSRAVLVVLVVVVVVTAVVLSTPIELLIPFVIKGSRVLKETERLGISITGPE